MPKPDVVALTGGYRRTPFMQIGADIYCDTALMCRVIDRLRARAAAVSRRRRAASPTSSRSGPTRRCSGPPCRTRMQPAGAAHVFAGAPPEYAEGLRRRPRGDDRRHAARDRRRRRRGAAELPRRGSSTMLADGRPFLLGARAVIADFSAAHSIWFMRRAPPVARCARRLSRELGAGTSACTAFGHGAPTPMSSDEAIAIAAAADGHAPHVRCAPEPGFAAGDRRHRHGRPTTRTTRSPARLVGLDARRGRHRARRRARRHGARALSRASASTSRRSRRTDTHEADFKGRTAVITGAGSGFGLEASRIAARARHERRDGRRAAGRARRAPPPRSQALGAAGAGAPHRRLEGGRGRGARRGDRGSASARRTSSSTTPASAPAG